TPEQEAAKKRLSGEIASLKAGIESGVGQVDVRFKAWLSAALEPVTWTALKPESAKAQSGAPLKVSNDNSVLAGGAVPDRDTYHLTFSSSAPLKGLRLEALADPSLSTNGPGRADNGNFVLTNVQLFADGKPVSLAISKTDYTQDDFDANEAL